MHPGTHQYHLIETAVADVDGVRVGLANVWEESFTGDDGEFRSGVRGTICFMRDGASGDLDIRVGLGDEFVLDGRRYRVIEIDDGEPRGSLTLERDRSGEVAGANVSQQTPGREGTGCRFRWIDVALPLPFLVLPYIASSAAARAGVAVVCIVAWILVTRPNWRGLQGLWGTGLLLLHALAWIAVALGTRFFS
ncbi:MAG TPA: hypothetical protein ENK43_01620 [Planctomycetes bacterium]|nr:hypothetical protein [Planctomycetota bacterium]